MRGKLGLSPRLGPSQPASMRPRTFMRGKSASAARTMSRTIFSFNEAPHFHAGKAARTLSTTFIAQNSFNEAPHFHAGKDPP